MTTHRKRTLSLSAVTSSVPAGRHFVQGILSEWDLGAIADVAALVVTELLTNAVRYAGTPIHLVIRVNGELYIGVSDERPDRLPAPLHPGSLDDLDAEGGRGLGLVAAYTRDWGVRRDDTSKTVWFTLPIAA